MTVEEKDRLAEILLYYYFINWDDKAFQKTTFWIMIKTVCEFYDIDSISISKAVRILLAKENAPTDLETYYLLSKIGVTVRPLYKTTKIYWAKQIEFDKQIKDGFVPTIKRRITDIVMKKSIRDFIFAMYNISGIFSILDYNLLKKTFSI